MVDFQSEDPLLFWLLLSAPLFIILLFSLLPEAFRLWRDLAPEEAHDSLVDLQRRLGELGSDGRFALRASVDLAPRA